MINDLKATPRQREVLRRLSHDTTEEEIQSMSISEASDCIGASWDTWRKFEATQRQEYFLRKWNQWKPGLNRGAASELIAAIKKRTATMTPDEVTGELIRAQREMALGISSEVGPAQ
jgi:hypothetical protein